MLNNPLQLIGLLQNSNNPMGVLQQLLGNNPQYRQIMQMIQGKSPQEIEQYVRNLYQSQGQDINQVASQFGLNI
jgi:DNA-binding FadR family transcriptional regulator